MNGELEVFEVDLAPVELGAVLVRGTRIGDVALTFDRASENRARGEWPAAVVLRPVEVAELKRLRDGGMDAALRLAIDAKRAGATLRANRPAKRDQPGAWLEYTRTEPEAE